MWSSTGGKPIRLAGSTYYRLDYLEIDPAHRGAVLGAFVIALVACRALELSATGIVLTAFPIDGLVEFYEAVGAAQRAPKGWNYPKELVALTFDSLELVRLKGLADALLEESKA